METQMAMGEIEEEMEDLVRHVEQQVEEHREQNVQYRLSTKVKSTTVALYKTRITTNPGVQFA